MKKVLLSAVAICCFGMAPAQESSIAPFQHFEGVITSVSSGGSYAVGAAYGNAYFVNGKTGKLTVFSESGVKYYIRNVSDCGIAGASYTPNYGTQTACYLTEDKGAVLLPLAGTEDEYSSACAGGPDDGSFLAGNVSFIERFQDEGVHTQQPVIWYRNASGEYDLYEKLPFNKIDFSKRPAQGAYILGVSCDGLRIFGRAIDYSGLVYLPVMWERSSAQSKDWSYKEFCTDYEFNKEKPVPEWPQYKPAEPDATEYWSEEEAEAYNKALELYNDSVKKADWTLPADEREPYPTYDPRKHKDDFFDKSTPEGIERYNSYAEAYNVYVAEGEVFNDSVSLFNDRFYDYITEDRFNILNMSISQNGKYMVTTTRHKSVVINSDTEEVTAINEGYYPTAVLDDGTVFLGQIVGMPPFDRIPSVYENGAVIGFGEWVKKRSEKAYKDLEDNFYDMHLGVVSSNNPDGVVFGGFNQSDFDSGYKGWIMNLAAYDDYTTGIAASKISEDDIKIFPNPAVEYIEIGGTDRADVRIFSVNGSCVYNKAGVSGRISVSSLARGTYIVEVRSGNDVVRRKIILV